MDDSPKQPDDEFAMPLPFQRLALLTAIHRETKHMRTAKYTLEATLMEVERRYRDDLTGNPITLPPGAIVEGRPKMFFDRRMIEPDILADILQKTFERIGIDKPYIVATTRGAWISNQTLDQLLAWNEVQQAESTLGMPRYGANKFAHILTMELNGRGQGLWR